MLVVHGFILPDSLALLFFHFHFLLVNCVSCAFNMWCEYCVMVMFSATVKHDTQTKVTVTGEKRDDVFVFFVKCCHYSKSAIEILTDMSTATPGDCQWKLLIKASVFCCSFSCII